MVDRLVHENADGLIKFLEMEQHVQYDPRYNYSPLVGYKLEEISMADFAKGQYQLYSPYFREYRQLGADQFVPLDPDELNSHGRPMLSCMRPCYIYYGLLLNYATTTHHSEGLVKFYHIGCRHKWKQISARGFEKTNECELCGTRWSYDTSG